MKLMYLEQDAVDDIKINYSKYESHFKDEDNQWFINYFKKNNWLKETKIDNPGIVLNKDASYDVSDRKNIAIIYDTLCDLHPSIAMDERLWAGMLFSDFWDYVQYRRKKEIESGIEQDIKNSFLFMRGTKRSCFMNCLSRLWWTGHLLYDAESQNPYHAVDLIAFNAYASNIVLISSNNFIANRQLALGVLDCMEKRQAAGDKIGRYHYVEANKYINCIGGMLLLDTMTRNEICNLVNDRLNNLFGEFNI